MRPRIHQHTVLSSRSLDLEEPIVQAENALHQSHADRFGKLMKGKLLFSLGLLVVLLGLIRRLCASDVIPGDVPFFRANIKFQFGDFQGTRLLKNFNEGVPATERVCFYVVQ